MITTEQRKRRRAGLGSSDSAAIHGLCGWQTDHDVWLSKVHELRDVSSEAIFLGNLLEPALIQWARDQTGVDFVADVMDVSQQAPVLVANFDGIHAQKRVGCEAKTRGLLWPAGGASDEWGADGSDEVPADVFLQCQHQMFVGDLDLVWVPALIGGMGLRMYCVLRADDAFVSGLVARDNDWWCRHVVANVRPRSIPSFETAKRIVREPAKPVKCISETVRNFLSARAVELAAKKRTRAADAALLSELGDGDCVLWDGPDIRRQTVKRRAYTAAASEHERWNIPNGL